MTGDGRFVEVQGTAEGEPYDRALLDSLLDLGTVGCAHPDRNCRTRHWAARWRRANELRPPRRPGDPQREEAASSCAAILAGIDSLADIEVLGLADSTPPFDEPAETELTFARERSC